VAGSKTKLAACASGVGVIITPRKHCMID